MKFKDIKQGDKFFVKRMSYGMKVGKECVVTRKEQKLISIEYCQNGNINNPKDELYNIYNSTLNFNIKEFNLTMRRNKNE